jgi:hypothetical protein
MRGSVVFVQVKEVQPVRHVEVANLLDKSGSFEFS